MDVISHQPHGSSNSHHLCGHGIYHNRGFTLLQLLTSIAIISVSLAIGIPNVTAMIQTNRMANAMNTLSRNFALARSAAVTRNQEVLICASGDGRYCTRKGGWEQGWIVFIDADGDERRGEEEQILWVQEALPPGVTVVFSAFRSDYYVHYWPSGFTEMNGTFTFCYRNSAMPPKALILNKIGRIRKSQTQWDGAKLECT